ncbi:MAG: InlB B-repeat-containing protein [Lachnospiraceae bacterium]|nr:InlB B-repeat-containing protein [Lachnospiraceae bacterium]
MKRRLRGRKYILRSILSLILTAALVLDMLPFVPTGLKVRADGYTSVGSLDALNNALTGTGNKYIKLTADITDSREAGELQIGTGTNVDLDLNGHSLTVNSIIVTGRLTVSDKTEDHNGAVNSRSIVCGDPDVENQTEDNNLVLESGLLALEQSIIVCKNWKFLMTGGTVTGGVDNNGTFNMTGGTINGRVANRRIFNMSGGLISTDSGNAVLVDGESYDNTVFTLSGGEISGNTDTNSEGVVYLQYGASFVMDGGKICDNKTRGVFVWHNSTFTMNDGEISGNSKNDGGGGGVYIEDTDSLFVMNGGTIAGNTALGGGGVCVWNFIMNGGKICRNLATEKGGGVLSNYRVEMNGGEITGNTAGGNGGGLCGGFSRISGNPVIKGNVSGVEITDGVLTGGTVNNWYALHTGIPVTGALTEGAYIGATKDDFIEWTNGKTVLEAAESYNGGKLTQTDVEAIVSDSGDFFIALNDAGKGVYIKGYPVNFDSDGGSSVDTQYIAENGTAERPESPVKENSLFAGWYEEIDGELFGDPYNFNTPVTAPVTLKAKWAEASLAIEDWTYGEAAKAPVLNKPEGSGEVTYTYYTDENLSVKTVSDNGAEGGVPKKAGTYYLKAEIEQSDDYGPGTLVKAFNIRPKTVGVEWGDTAFTYDGNEKKPAAAATGLLEGDECVLSVTGGGVNANAEGEHYTARVESLSNHDYALPETGLTKDFTIAKRAVTVKAKDQTVELNGSIENIAAQAEMSGAIGGDTLSKVTLTADSTAHATDKGVITPSAAGIVNGEIDVTANYKISYENGVLKVSRALAVFTEPVAKEKLSFTGEEQELITAGSSRDGILYYALTAENKAPEFDGLSEKADRKWKKEVPSAKEAGTYYVWYMLIGDADHNDTEAKAIEVKISEETTPTPADPTPAEPTPEPEPEPVIGLQISFDPESISMNAAGEYEAVYSGAEIKPGVIIRNNGELLTENVDYTLKYEKNTACGEAKAVISGKTRFGFKESLKFKIAARDVADELVLAGNTVYTKGKDPDPVLSFAGEVLRRNSDYSLKINGNMAVISGMKNFCGTRSLTLTELDAQAYKAAAINVRLGKVSRVYNGQAQILDADELKVTDKAGNVLTEGKDYLVSYSDNVNTGTVKLTVTAAGNYTGKADKSFKITPDKKAVFIVTADKSEYEFEKAGVYPVISVCVKDSDRVLKEGVDYSVTFSSNKKVGNGKFKLSFKGNYKGARYNGNSSFKIVKRKASEENVQIIAENMAFKNKANYKPTVYVTVNGELLSKSDVKVEYEEKNKLNAPKDNCRLSVTIRGKKYETAEKGKSFSVSYNVAEGKTKINGGKIKFNVKSLPYTGREIRPDSSIIKLKAGSKLISGKELDENFEIYYADNIEGGKVTVLLKAKADSEYAGIVKGTIKIGKSL